MKGRQFPRLTKVVHLPPAPALVSAYECFSGVLTNLIYASVCTNSLTVMLSVNRGSFHTRANAVTNAR